MCNICFVKNATKIYGIIRSQKSDYKMSVAFLVSIYMVVRLS